MFVGISFLAASTFSKVNEDFIPFTPPDYDVLFMRTVHVDPSYVWSWSTLLGCILRADEYWFNLLFIRFIAILSSRWFLFTLSRSSMNFRISSLNLSNYAWMQIHLVLGLTSLLAQFCRIKLSDEKEMRMLCFKHNISTYHKSYENNLYIYSFCITRTWKGVN